MDIFSFGVNEFKTFGESTLAKELALVISADSHLAIRLFELFLDDGVLGGRLRSRARSARNMMVHNCDCLYLLSLDVVFRLIASRGVNCALFFAFCARQSVLSTISYFHYIFLIIQTQQICTI